MAGLVWLVLGSAPRDQRGGVRLEHATLDLAARFDARVGAQVAAGWHDRDGAHLEAARLVGEFDRWRLVLGRDTVRLGTAIDSAGHFDRFSQPPLARRAALNDQWIDDGAALAWQPNAHGQSDGLRRIEAGLWRGRAFPGGAGGPPVPTLQFAAGQDDVHLDLALAHFEPEGRGAAARSAGASGHVHGTLDCRASLAQRVCFDGRVDLLAAALSWQPDGPFSVSAAGLWRRERGLLYSTSGEAALRSRIVGGWLDLAWQARAHSTLALRLERLVPTNRLEGTGTLLLARESGLEGGGAVERATLALVHELRDDLRIAVEAGHERDAARSVSHVALRLVWQRSALLGADW